MTSHMKAWPNFKTAGNVKAQVMVQAFVDGYKQKQFIQVLYVQGHSEWTSLLPASCFLYVGTDCYGVWKIAPPATEKPTEKSAHVK